MSVISSYDARFQKNQIVAGLSLISGNLKKKEGSKDESPLDLSAELDLYNKKSLETILYLLRLLRKKKTRTQEPIDTSSDTRQKFTMNNQLGVVNSERDLKEAVRALSAYQQGIMVENHTTKDETNRD